jgi:hypothetical protein
MEKRYNQFNRQIDSIQTVLTYSPQGTWAMGLEGGVSLLDYEQPVLNDAIMGNLGMFFRTQLGSTTFLRVSAGIQQFDFEKPSVPPPLGTGDFNDLSDYYLNFSISNQINNRLSHVLSLGHESALNLTSNFITANFINYGMSIITSKGGRLSLTGFFEDARPSSPINQTDLIQYGFDTYYNHQITSKIRMGVGYHFGRTDSESPTGDFDQHAFNLDFTTALTQKASLNFGYRYFLTNAYNSSFDFQQHRVILGLNYNF